MQLPLWQDNFGQRPTTDDDVDDLKALDPLKQLEAVDSTRTTESNSELTGEESPSQDLIVLDPLLRNPNGATQMFTDMHEISSGLEDSPDIGPAKTGMRHMAGLTVGAQRLGITDWGSGTDGGRSGKPQDGVPYGSFVGV
jgi:hypothetical protein